MNFIYRVNLPVLSNLWRPFTSIYRIEHDPARIRYSIDRAISKECANLLFGYILPSPYRFQLFPTSFVQLFINLISHFSPSFYRIENQFPDIPVRWTLRHTLSVTCRAFILYIFIAFFFFSLLKFTYTITYAKKNGIEFLLENFTASIHGLSFFFFFTSTALR